MEAPSTSCRCSHSQTQPVARRGWRQALHRALRLRVEATSYKLPVQTGYLNHEPVPVPQKYAPTVVPGFRTRPTPLLDVQQMVTRLQKAMDGYGMEHFGAFYSSAMGGIVTDPSLMMMPVADQFVCKGYGVSEVVLLRDGHLYMLDQHIQRLQAACAQLGLALPFPEPALRRILLDTAAASGRMNGHVRCWVTPGRGGFTPFQVGGAEPALYALCLGDTLVFDRMDGWDAVTVKRPVTSTGVSDVHGNQQLVTSLAQVEAAKKGAQATVFTDAEGFVQHCSGLTLCILTQSDGLVFPPNDCTPPSVTLQRMLELIPGEIERSPDDVIIKNIVQRQMHVTEIAAAKEAFVLCTSYTIIPIKTIDEKPIADGKTGLTTLALHYMLDNDQMPPTKPEQFTPLHVPVPYGYMSGMRSQLM